MCYYVRRTKGRVAKEDIAVDKYFEWLNKSIVSPYRSYPYIKAIQPKIPLIIDRRSRPYTISKGYHSYIEGTDAVSFFLKQQIGIKCIIPKGAEYFTNGFQIVSDQIILTNKIFQLDSPYLREREDLIKNKLDKLVNKQ